MIAAEIEARTAEAAAGVLVEAEAVDVIAVEMAGAAAVVVGVMVAAEAGAVIRFVASNSGRESRGLFFSES